MVEFPFLASPRAPISAWRDREKGELGRSFLSGGGGVAKNSLLAEASTAWSKAAGL